MLRMNIVSATMRSAFPGTLSVYLFLLAHFYSRLKNLPPFVCLPTRRCSGSGK